MVDRHPYFNAKHSKNDETDITITIISAANRAHPSEGKFGPQIQYPMTIQVNEIESIGGTVDGDNNPVKEGSLYSWFCPEKVFQKICAKECNSNESSFILSRPASEKPKESVIQISRAKSAGPNVELDSASSAASSSGPSNGHSNGHPNGHSNESSNGHTTPPMDSGERLKNILGVGVEIYVLVDRFLKSENVSKINNERGFEYGVDEYLKLFNFFQFKYKDGFGHVQKPFFDAFNDDFPKLIEALAAQEDANRALDKLEKKTEEKEAEEKEAEEEEAEEEEPVSANGASSDEDDLPF